jgi:ATP synthase I chain
MAWEGQSAQTEMEDPNVSELSAEEFYSAALLRITRLMKILVVFAALAVWLAWGWEIAGGFVAGGVVAYLNFRWLKSAVVALADKVTQTGTAQRSGRVVFRFMLRYLIAIAVAIALFRVAPEALKGFLAGLFLPVAAIICEAFYEAYVAVTRKI